MRRQKRFDWLEIFLFFLGILLAILIFVTVIVIAYPTTGDRAIRNVRDSFESAFGFDPQTKITSFFVNTGRRAKEGWEQRVVKIPDKVRSVKIASPIKKPKAEIDKEKLRKVFAECKKCHRDYLQRAVFENIYMDHKKHITEKVECFDCHKENKHPKPLKVEEKICLDCHKKTNNEKIVSDCEACHTPGSIYNAKKGDSPSIQKFLASRKISSIMPSGFEHGKSEACKNCHEAPEFCNKCHMVFHNKLPNWLNIHGPSILAKKYTVAGCVQCHKNTWCASKCHPNPNRERQEGTDSLPLVPIDNYIW